MSRMPRSERRRSIRPETGWSSLLLLSAMLLVVGLSVADARPLRLAGGAHGAMPVVALVAAGAEPGPIGEMLFESATAEQLALERLVLGTLELHAGAIARCHCHDPSWQNWPVLEHAVIGNIVPDFPLINKSFNLSYSGQDL